MKYLWTTLFFAGFCVQTGIFIHLLGESVTADPTRLIGVGDIVAVSLWYLLPAFIAMLATREHMRG